MHLSDALRNCSIFIKRHLVSGVAKTLRWFGWVLIFQLLVRIVDFFVNFQLLQQRRLLMVLMSREMSVGFNLGFELVRSLDSELQSY